MAKAGNIVGERVKFEIFANKVAQLGMFTNNAIQFGYIVGQQIQVKQCLQHACTCSKNFGEHLLLDGKLFNLSTMFANNSTHSGKSCGRNMRKSLESIVTSMTLVAKWRLNQGERAEDHKGEKVPRVDVGRVENRSTPT